MVRPVNLTVILIVMFKDKTVINKQVRVPIAEMDISTIKIILLNVLNVLILVN